MRTEASQPRGSQAHAPAECDRVMDRGIRMVEQFTRFGRELFLQGVNSSHSGNISVRAGDRIFITRRGSMLAGLVQGDIIETGLREDDGHITLASTEIKIHPAIYLQTSALAIVHAHPPFAIAISMDAEEIVPMDTEGVYYFKTIPVIGRPHRWLGRSGGEAAAAAPELQGRHDQGTRQFCCRPDAGRGVSVDIQPGGFMQDAISSPPALSSKHRGGGREMVMVSPLSAARPSSASFLTHRMRRARKEEKLPAAARNQKGPELSAREANTNPATNNSGLGPFIAQPACHPGMAVTIGMLAPPSDKTPEVPVGRAVA